MAVLTHKSVPKTLLSMAVPMLAGTFAMNAYNLADTWFVARLGTLPLAAMGFSFPVVMLLNCVVRGVSSSVTTLSSFELGKSNTKEASKLLTHGLVFTMLCMALLVAVCAVLIDNLFLLLGVTPEVLPLVREYMYYWFPGALFMVVPVLGGGILMSVGSSKYASIIMIIGTVINLILDPLLIFGYFGFPQMGIRGAALATSISHAITAIYMIYLLTKKHPLLAWPDIRLSRYYKTFRRIMLFAIPGIASMVMTPASVMVVTKIISQYGVIAVAATGAASRLEMFAFMIPMALGMSLTPFISQNFGANRLDRVHEAQKFSITFALVYGALTTVFFIIAAPWMAAIFTDDPKVAKTLIHYLRIVSFGYGMVETHRYCTFFLNGMHNPISSALLNALRVVVLMIPLTYIGGYFWGISGVFEFRLATDIIAGAIGIFWLILKQRNYKAQLAKA